MHQRKNSRALYNASETISTIIPAWTVRSTQEKPTLLIGKRLRIHAKDSDNRDVTEQTDDSTYEI
jgi:hypothetical protein